MYCPNCGETIPDSARACGFCGYRLSARDQKPHQQAAPPVQPIIVQTHSGGGIFSSCTGALNFVLGALVVGLMAIMALVFLCVIHLPADFPLIDPPAPLQNLWQRARDWQAESCPLTDADETDASGKQGEQTSGNDCNRSKFISETVKDNSDFAPGQTFTKTWTVRNDGSCTWTNAYTFRFTQGTRMEGEKTMNLKQSVHPGENYTFELDLVAPEEPGTYTGRWEIFDEKGNSFGWYTVMIDVVVDGGDKPLPDATIFVNPTVGLKCSRFKMSLSGYGANEEIALEFAYLTDPSVYKNVGNIKTDENGEASLDWYANVTKGGQYIVWGRSPSAVGSAVFIVEAADECDCAGNCPESACSQADTQAACEAAGGQWQHIFVDPGPSFDTCICPGVNPFE